MTLPLVVGDWHRIYLAFRGGLAVSASWQCGRCLSVALFAPVSGPALPCWCQWAQTVRVGHD